MNKNKHLVRSDRDTIKSMLDENCASSLSPGTRMMSFPCLAHHGAKNKAGDPPLFPCPRPPYICIAEVEGSLLPRRVSSRSCIPLSSAWMFSRLHAFRLRYSPTERGMRCHLCRSWVYPLNGICRIIPYVSRSFQA